MEDVTIKPLTRVEEWALEQQELAQDIERNPFVTLPDGRVVARIAGGENPPDSDDEPDDDDDEDDDDEDDDEDDDGDEKDHVRMPKSEAERLRRIAAEKDKLEKETEKERKKRLDKERKERGEWEEIIQEKEEKITETEAERDEARFELEAFRKKIMLQGVGKRLGFRDPDDLSRHLPDDETESEQDAERAAKRLLREKPYLKQERSATGLSGDGGVEVDGLTMEDVKKMSPDEVNANWDRVQKVMSASSGTSAGSSSR